MLPLPLLALLLCGVRLSAALYEDQAGTFDWYKQNVGLIRAGGFLSKGKPRLCALTKQSVVGCLSVKDGTVAWRKLLDGGQDASFMLIEDHSLLVAATHSLIQAFDMEGHLKWEERLASCSHAGDLGPNLLKLSGKQQDGQRLTAVAVQHGSSLTVYNAWSGAVLATGKQPADGRTGRRTLLLSLGGQQVMAASYQDGAQEVSTTAVQVSDGGEAAAAPVQGSLRSPLPLSHVAVASERGFAALSTDLASVCVAAAAGGDLASALSCTALADLAPQLAAGSPSLSLLPTSSGYVLYDSSAAGGAAVLQEGDGGALKLLQYYARVAAVSAEASSDKGPVLAFVEQPAPGKLLQRIVSSSSGETVLEEQYADQGATAAGQRLVPGSAAPGVLSNVVLGLFKKKDKTDGFRLLASYSDGRAVCMQQGTVVWARDESLATITSSLFVDLPASVSGGVGNSSGGSPLAGDLKPDFKTQLRYQVLGAKVQLKLSSEEEEKEFQALRPLLSDRTKAYRDVNGFRKLILALTQTGKLVAMHNGDGRVMWARSYAAADAPTRLLPWRTFHDVTHAPLVLLLRDVQPGAYAAVVDAHTGQELSRTHLPFAVDLVVPVQEQLHSGAEYQSQYLLVSGAASAAPAVHLLPDSAPARDFFVEHYRALYFWTSDKASGRFAGYGFDGGAAAAAAAGNGAAGGRGIPAVQVWQLQLPDPVLTVAVRDPSEPVQTSVKVLSDRTITYKYLNPNTIFIATGTAQAARALPQGGEDGGAGVDLTAYVVDTATGRVLYRQVHERARGPVTALFTENLVLYYYWDAATARPIAVSLELYDANPSRTFNVLDYLFNPNYTQPVSSFEPTPVNVTTLSFFSRLVPAGLTATRTLQGITAKMVLVVTNTDQVYAMDRRWVDPRRPKKQKLSQEEAEERLIPYQELLAVSTQSFATLDKQVLSTHGVVVEPTRLESTCLLFVHGVDLFYSRLSPVKGFDSLEDDFNYALLMAALAGLAVGAAVMHVMVKKAALKQKWQ